MTYIFSIMRLIQHHIRLWKQNYSNFQDENLTSLNEGVSCEKCQNVREVEHEDPRKYITIVH